jgi:cell filamentation protein, protein adenylyltransferase
MSTKHESDDISKVTWLADEPYQDLPLLPPGVDLETSPVMRATIGARAALAELKQAIKLIPNPKVLVSSLPLLEAQASSEIENIVTTADELFRHLDADAGASPATREALRYREALLEGYRALREFPLTFGVAERICTRIKAIEMSPRKIPGTSIANRRTGEVVYTPPVGETLIRDLLANWERFMHGEGVLDPLVRMAVAHYQFEAIHPFTDGNGRTGRILNSLFLVERGLLGAPVLYLSRYIIQNKADYYRHLRGVTRDENWEPWLLYILAAVEETSTWTLGKIEAIRSLIEDTREYVRGHLPKIYSAELVDQLFERPYCRIGHLVDAGVAKRETASKYLKEIARLGMLEEQTHGREKIFVNTRFLTLLTTEQMTYLPLGS